MKMVLVSVIMGSYNHEKYIGEAIESVLNQTCKDLELIIVDDASKDNSRALIEAYSVKEPRVRAFFHKVNLGIARTINDCLKQALRQYSLFLPLCSYASLFLVITT